MVALLKVQSAGSIPDTDMIAGFTPLVKRVYKFPEIACKACIDADTPYESVRLMA